MGYYVTVEPGANLYVEDLNPGGKRTIVFLHGWPLSYRQFEYQFDVLPTLGFRCIGIDWRGFGKSDKPWHGYNFDRLADDVRVIIDALRLSDCILVGHSTGGAIAIRYAARHHAHGVSQLVLVDAAAPIGLKPDVANGLLQKICNDRPRMMRDLADDFYFQYVSEPFREWFIGLGLQAAGWSTAAVVVMLRDENMYADLPHVGVPTAIVHGVQDKIIPFSQAEELHRLIPHSVLYPFQYSGHGSYYEERGKFNQLLASFMTGASGNAGAPGASGTPGASGMSGM